MFNIVCTVHHTAVWKWTNNIHKFLYLVFIFGCSTCFGPSSPSSGATLVIYINNITPEDGLDSPKHVGHTKIKTSYKNLCILLVHFHIACRGCFQNKNSRRWISLVLLYNTLVIAFTSKTMSINYICRLCGKYVIRTDFIKDLAVLFWILTFFCQHHVD